MADVISPRGDHLPKRFQDNLDGTYSEIIAGTFSADPPVGGATSALQETGNASLDSIDDKLPAALLNGRLVSEPLRELGVSRRSTTTNANQTVTLTTTCRAISLHARGVDCRIVIATGSPTANASTSHFIAAGERIDVNVAANSVVAVIRDTDATSDGSLEISELLA